MVYLEKSQPAPCCLSIEKAKANGDYKCETVLERIKFDFLNKCYICEYKEPIAINTTATKPRLSRLLDRLNRCTLRSFAPVRSLLLSDFFLDKRTGSVLFALPK